MLCYMVIVFNFLKTGWNSGVASPFCTPTINLHRFQILPIVSTLHYFLIVLLIAILIGIRWYLSMVLICISVMSNVVILRIFPCDYWPIIFLLWRNDQVLNSIIELGYVIFCSWVWRSFQYIVSVNPFPD